ncbi:CPBP family intramembrane glutamic endopeptidase [Dokdonella soli]|uniref:Type II CAAX endopeptidase family protein n=1 Tax=Dokdonella soli TaxID=529810 RepID=A0ABN1IEH6_9GAMM
MFSSSRTNGIGAMLGYVGCYVAALIYLSVSGGEGAWLDALVSFAILGVAFPALAVLLTRKIRLPELRSAAPAATGMVIYLAVFALVVLGFGFTAIHREVQAEPLLSITLLVIKLMTMVAVPALILGMLTGGMRDWFAPRWHTQRLWLPLVGIGVAMLMFEAIFGRGLMTLSALHAAPTVLVWAVPACFVWLSLEVGITEEFLFRVALQSSLADRLRSPVAGVVIAALLFGLAHAPGLYLRGSAGAEGVDTPVSISWAMAYSVAVISPSGILFGVLWARTRSFALIIVLHALTDLLPNVAPFLQGWIRHAAA